jgi:hypothetical protein
LPQASSTQAPQGGNQPQKKQLSVLQALAIIAGVVAAIYLLTWAVRFLMAVLIEGVFDSFGDTAGIVFALAIAVIGGIGYLWLGRSEKKK